MIKVGLAFWQTALCKRFQAVCNKDGEYNDDSVQFGLHMKMDQTGDTFQVVAVANLRLCDIFDGFTSIMNLTTQLGGAQMVTPTMKLLRIKAPAAYALADDDTQAPREPQLFSFRQSVVMSFSAQIRLSQSPSGAP